MADGENNIEKLDAFVADLFASWNIYTIVFAVFLSVYLIYPLLTWKDPDTHPFLLARQAGASPIRQSGESPIYRAVEIPYGYPLRAGLGVKDPGAPKWSSGRNGDLRDIWRQAVRGPVKDDGSAAGAKGKIITVLGREKIVEHSLDDLTRDINVIGKYMQDSGVKSAAICLPNSVEFITGFFAASFYQVQLTLIPYGVPQDTLNRLLTMSPPDLLIAHVGTVDLKSAISASSSLKHVLWVTQPGSQHMDWNEVPEGTGGDVGVTVWQELIDEKATATSAEVLPLDKDSKVMDVTTFWPKGNDGYELVVYTSENLVAAVAGLNAALARSHRLSSTDLVLPAQSLTLVYPLCATLASLFSNASVALNSVAGETVDVVLAAAGISPTVIIASSKTATDLHQSFADLQSGIVAGITKSMSKRTLQAGNMPATTATSLVSSNFSKLRLLLIAHRAGDPSSPQLSHSTLTDLRLLFGARIGYALTAFGAAGAICQTNVLDYREKAGSNHFGAPLSCVEVRLVGQEEAMSGDSPQGKIVVGGPAVSGGQQQLEVIAKFEDDNTLVLV